MPSMRTGGIDAICALGCVALTLLAAAPGAGAQEAVGTLTIVVLDPSGAPVPTASIAALDGPGDIRAIRWVYRPGADGGFVAALDPGRYRFHVAAPGFAPVVIDVTLRQGGLRRIVQLPLAQIVESIVVARDRQDAALDPRGFSTFLSREQIEALPDDPELLVQALEALAPPGAVIRVDGFTGGPVPPKSQILSIRLPRLDSFAAQHHGGLAGLGYIDIVTTPGGGRLQGSGEVAVRHHALDARNPLASEPGSQKGQMAALTADGPLVAGRASFAAALRLFHEEEAAAMRAILPDGGSRSDPVTRPADRVSATGRVTTSLPADQTLRLGVSAERRQLRNLGAGGINLPERAYTTTFATASVRASAGGPIGRRGFLDARAQLSWTRTHSESLVEAPAVLVLDAFARGGAQADGGDRALELEAAADVDYARGAHAWRFGWLLEAGAHRTDRRSNYLGTYTFTSIAAFAAGRPASYSRRLGDTTASYGNVQVGLYAQDDYRASRSVLLSYGVRYERQTLTGGGGRLLPRGGMTWSPRSTGTTVLRAGGGLFSEWIPTSVYEQALLLDGSRQHDVLVPNPSYPDPPDGAGAESGLPRERYLLNADLRLSSAAALSAGVEQHVHGVRVSVSYTRRIGWDLPRGRNLNAPRNGSRPDPASSNVIEAVSDAGLRAHVVSVQAGSLRPSQPITFVLAYLFTRMASNTAGAFAIPPSGRLDDDWAPTTPAHAMTGLLTVRPVPSLTVAVQPQWRSGMPYTITTGHDDNGDGLFTDRPAGLPRHSGRTPPYFELAARVSYVVRVGRTSVDSPAPGLTPPALPSTGDQSRYRVELFVSARNVTNRANYVSVGSVMSSPLFGQPVVALNPRQLELGVRLGF